MFYIYIFDEFIKALYYIIHILYAIKTAKYLENTHLDTPLILGTK